MRTTRPTRREASIWAAIGGVVLAVVWLVSAASTGINFAVAGGQGINRGVVVTAVALAVLLLLALLFLLRRLWGAAHPHARRRRLDGVL
jgi:mannose/fructose/N-acetylgalactosamine-specific phosphotransferase system component IIC